MSPNVEPFKVFFYWPEAVLGNFYWPGVSGSLLALSPGYVQDKELLIRRRHSFFNPLVKINSLYQF